MVLMVEEATAKRLELLALADRAEKAIHELCVGPERGGRRWTMSVPAEPKRDHDLIFSDLVREFRALLDREAE